MNFLALLNCKAFVISGLNLRKANNIWYNYNSCNCKYGKKIYIKEVFDLKGNNECKFNDAENTVVFTTRQVVAEGVPILYVSHDEDDGAWQFHQGSDVDIEDARIMSLEMIVALDDTLNQLFDLPLGWIATRESIDDPWNKRENKSEL